MTILELLRLAQAAEERGDKAGARRLYEQAGQQTRIQAEIERLMRRARRSMALSFVMMVVSVVLIVISVWQWMR